MAQPLGENDPVPHITFTFQDDEEFQPFITVARNQLANDETEFLISDSNNYEYYVIRLIRDDVDLFAYMKRDNLYITGFRTSGVTYEFSGFSEFEGSVELPYKESYPLEVEGFLCYYGFETTVTTLIAQMRAPGSDKWGWRNNIFVVIIHLAEAIRYRLLSNAIHLTKAPAYRQPVPINGWILLLIKGWKLISTTAKEYKGDSYELDPTEMELMQGYKDQKDTYSQHLKVILQSQRICNKLVAILLEVLLIDSSTDRLVFLSMIYRFCWFMLVSTWFILKS